MITRLFVWIINLLTNVRCIRCKHHVEPELIAWDGMCMRCAYESMRRA